MAIFKPGRLKRLLDRVVGPGTQVFVFYTQLDVFYEDRIHEVVIHRGKSERGGGLHPSTLEIRVAGQLPAVISGTDSRFFIRDVPADRIAAHLDGASSGADLAMRSVGRIGQLDIEDTGKRFTSTLSSASWTARMLRRKSRVTVPQPGQTPGKVLRDAIGATDSNPPAGITMTEHGPFDTVATVQDAINFADAVTKFGSDIGVSLLETRAGATRVVSLPYRTAQAELKAASWLPLVRSQAIAPANWSQQNDAPAITLKYTITNPSGNVVERTIEVQNWDPTFETVHEDWSYMKSESSGTAGQSYQEGYGRVYETSSRIFRLPSVKLDMISLIGSDKQYHREVAAQVLRMEVGDPVFFSGDWPSELRGVQFAEGITETLNSEAWEVELSLCPWSHVLGAAAQPQILPRVWDSAVNRWNDDPLQWQQF